ncbi:MAG: methionyl-tRNA formyltransferase [Pirellulales bacterium]
MRLVMLGTGPFAVPTLQALAASEHQVALVVTRPPRGRSQAASPLQRAAESLLEVWLPESVNTQDSQAKLASLGADLLVVCDYGEILRPATLAAARLGGINLHGSLLPKYRGAAPVQRAILNGETETGNSVIQMTPGLDAGPCLGQQKTRIDSDEDAGQLESRLAILGAELVGRVLTELAAGTARPIEQDARLASKAPRLAKEEGAIDWSRSALAIKNQVRALVPWPRAFTFWHRAGGPPVRLNIDRVALAPSAPGEAASARLGSPQAAAGPGAIVEATNRLLLATGDAAIDVLELQPAGKRAMSASEFLRGNRLGAGDRLGPA